MNSAPDSSPSRFPRISRPLCAALVIAACSGVAFGQFVRRGGGGGIYTFASEETRTARELPSRSIGFPEWKNPVGFQKDVLTFARLRYGGQGWPTGAGGGSWATDLPDADINLSFRLQQLTTIRTDPDGRVLRGDNPELFRYPFLTTAAPGAMVLSDSEARGLRAYLENGGFFLLTDFWGDSQWANFESQMKRVLPGRSFVELPLTHPIYHNVFNITAKNLVPRISIWQRSDGSPQSMIEYWNDQRVGGPEVHHRAILDDKGRIMVLALHNSDDSDGWEREGESPEYFHQFAEGMAYPLAINIIFYTMTH